MDQKLILVHDGLNTNVGYRFVSRSWGACVAWLSWLNCLLIFDIGGYLQESSSGSSCHLPPGGAAFQSKRTRGAALRENNSASQGAPLRPGPPWGQCRVSVFLFLG